jgi:hypothetical protein
VILDEIHTKRFFKKVTKTDSCWIWTGTKNTAGYGMFYIKLRGYRAHRISWELANKTPIPDGKLICHSCDNPPCVNPAHLWPGTDKENRWDSILKGRAKKPPHKKPQTHCKHGHKFTAANSYTYSWGRMCRTCTLARSKKRKLKLKQEKRK